MNEYAPHTIRLRTRREVLEEVQPHWITALAAIAGSLLSSASQSSAANKQKQGAAEQALAQKAAATGQMAGAKPPVSQMAAQRADVTSNPDVLNQRLGQMQIPGVTSPAQPAPFPGGNQTGQFGVPPAGAGNTTSAGTPPAAGTTAGSGGLSPQDYMQLAQMAGGLLGQGNQPIAGMPPGQTGQPMPSTASSMMQRRRRGYGF